MNELMNGLAMSKARQAFVERREQILDGRLPPGSRLTLRPIAKSLGVNVGAVSEAGAQLVHEQLVDFEPNYSAGQKLDLETMQSQHVLRIAIECEAIRLHRSSQRPQPRSIDRMAKEVDRLVSVEGTVVRSPPVRPPVPPRNSPNLRGAVAGVRAAVCHLAHLLEIDSTPNLRATQIANRTHVELVTPICIARPRRGRSAMREHCERSLFLQLQMTFGAVAQFMSLNREAIR